MTEDSRSERDVPAAEGPGAAEAGQGLPLGAFMGVASRTRCREQRAERCKLASPRKHGQGPGHGAVALDSAAPEALDPWSPEAFYT